MNIAYPSDSFGSTFQIEEKYVHGQLKTQSFCHHFIGEIALQNIAVRLEEQVANSLEMVHKDWNMMRGLTCEGRVGGMLLQIEESATLL